MKPILIGYRGLVFLAGLLFVHQTCFGQIVPNDRLATWNRDTVGVPGGIPNRTTIYTTVASGASLATVQAAVNACPSNQVVQLSAGSYTWPSGSSLNMKSGVTLRGAGATSTIINSSAGSAQHGEVGGITIASDVYSGANSTIGLASGYTKGSSNLVLSATDANLHVGYQIIVNQLNDGKLVYNGPAMPGGYLRTDITPEADGLRCMNQMVEVKALSGTSLTVWPPLYYTMSSGLTPHVFYWRSSSSARNYIQWAGVEDLQVVNSNSEGTCIGMNRTAYCWVKNCKTVNAAVYHIGAYRSYRGEIRHNTCDSSLNYTSSHGYVIVLEYQSSGCLIEDNIVVNNREFVEANSGSSGNVICYNYMTNAMPTPGYGFMVHSGGSHSAHPMFNLIEGNIGYKWNHDFYWGSGSHATILRNWFGRKASWASQMGAALVIDATNSYDNVVGNVLGYNGINSNPNWTTRYAYRVSPSSMAYDHVWASIRFGYSYDSDTGGGVNSTGQWADTIVAGNYDYVTGTQAWYNPSTAQTIPASYFYASKPAYFGNLAWPPIDAVTPTVGETVIPAGYRYAYGIDPPAESAGNQPPVVNASATPTSGTAPLSVSFSSAGSSDPEGTALTYNWAFGDGMTATTANPSHTYSSAGNYSARLTVSDGTNTATSGVLTIAATNPVNRPPVAVASATPVSGVAPLTVAFSSAGSSDPEGTALTYNWTFGDGMTATTANPSHTYLSAGDYSAQLSVSDGTNTAASGVLTIAATNAVNRPPVAVANATPASGVAPLTVGFSSAGSSDPEGAALTYNWTFGDGMTATAANPSHTYSSAGSYAAQLTVSDGTNSVSSSVMTIVVSAAVSTGPVAAYLFDEGSGSTANDSSGNGNTGTITGAAWATGLYGKALTFDGTNAVLVVNDSPSLDLTSGLTLEAWTYPTAFNGDFQPIVIKPMDAAFSSVSYVLQGASRSTELPSLAVSGSSSNLSGNSVLPLNTWSHLAGTYDGAAMRLYINGTLVSSQAQTGAITPSSQPLRIGMNWAGLIDEVRIYNRALSAAEVQADMNTALRPPAPSDLRIINAVWSNAAFSVAVPTQTGLTYVLEYTDSPDGTNWTAQPPVAGTGDAINLTDQSVTGRQRFYRVLQQ